MFLKKKKKNTQKKLTDQTADHEGERLEQKQGNPPYHQLFGAHVLNNGPRHGEGKVRSGGKKQCHTERGAVRNALEERRICGRWESELDPPSPPLCSCLLTSKEEGKSRNHMTGKDSADARPGPIRAQIAAPLLRTCI